MSVRSAFKRGIHIPEHKEATTGKTAEQVPSTARVVIPVNQHFGAPNQALVKPGDIVKRGQKIAENPGAMAVPVHASVAGKVIRIEAHLQSNNTEGPCIVIERAAEDETDFMPPLDPFTCTREEALNRVREAGLVGMGGAGFPSYIKLNPPKDKSVDVIIADGAECEPYLTTDEEALREHADKVVRGLAITMRITGVKTAIIGMEDNKASLAPALEAAAAKGRYEGEIRVRLCKTRYPQGGEKLLITALTGREVPSGGLPADAGCIVQNVGTLIAECEAFDEGVPLISRGFTVSGGACGKPKNVHAPIGTVISEIQPDFFAVDEGNLAKIISGGPMMGTALPSADFPVQKNTSGVLFLTKEETAAFKEGTCIRCGRCIRNCSARLHPVLMKEALTAGDIDQAAKLGLMDCFECGACSYLCPARIRLTQRFRVGKALLKERAARQKAAK